MVIAVATFDIKPGYGTRFIELAQDTIKATHGQDGNISYQLLRSCDDETTLIYLEEWEDDTAIQRHLQSDVYQTFVEARKPFINSPVKCDIFDATIRAAAK